MTTIAYSHKDQEIAYDSRECIGGLIASDSISKLIETDKGLFFISGSVPDGVIMAREFVDEKEFDKELDCRGIAILNDLPGVYGVGIDGGRFFKFPLEYDFAIGSGDYFAIAAMNFGESAVGAVEYAKTKDIYTGGQVNLYKL